MKRIIALVALAAVAVTPALGHAAPAATNFYFEGTGCDGDGIGKLSTSKAGGPECTFVGGGEAGVAPTSYTTKKGTKLKLDVTRKVTGTLYFHHNPLLTVIPVTAPGYVEATATFKVGTVKIGVVKVAGVSPPAGDLKQAISLALPASLKNVTAARVSVDVTFQKCTGLCTVSTTGANISNLSIPTK